MRTCSERRGGLVDYSVTAEEKALRAEHPTTAAMLADRLGEFELLYSMDV